MNSAFRSPGDWRTSLPGAKEVGFVKQWVFDKPVFSKITCVDLFDQSS